MRPPAPAIVLLAVALLLPQCPAAAAPPDPLPGRLFHSARERAALDRAPEALATAPSIPRQRARPPAARVPPEHSPALSGFVLRSDGLDSFWLEATPAAPASFTR